MRPVVSTVVFSLLLAHVLAEFPFQPRCLSERKTTNWRMKGLHGAIVLLSALILTAGIVNFSWAAILIGYALVHLAIDELTAFLESKIPRNAFEVGIVDQSLHLGSIILIGYGLPFYQQNALGEYAIQWLSIETWNRIVLWLAGYVLVFQAGTEFVRGLLLKVEPLKKSFAETNPKTKGAIPPEELQVGRIIGNLERLLILTFVLLGQFTAIGFVLTAKSIARFKELENRAFAEYFLIGTLASSVFAILIGLILSRLV